MYMKGWVRFNVEGDEELVHVTLLALTVRLRVVALDALGEEAL